MSGRGRTVLRKCLRVPEILSALECEDDNENLETLIYVEPPIERGDQATDEDSDKSDEEHNANLTHLGRKLRQSKCELQRLQANIDNSLPSTSSGLQSSNTGAWPPLSSSKESDDEDDIPLSSLQARNKPHKTSQAKKKRTTLWKKQLPNFPCTEYNTQPTSDESQKCKDPLDYFRLFFHKDLVKNIVDQTNLYAAQNNKSLLATEDEIYVILGAMLLSGYVKLPNKRLYFSRDNDVPKILAQSIRCNRFEAILQNLHLNDSTHLSASSDKFYKLRPLLDSLGKSFQRHYGLAEHYSVNKSMIPYYGKHYAKQFIRGKPIRFGFKSWALCVSTGYMVAFSLYMGKSFDKKHFGLDGDVVPILIELGRLPAQSGIKIYFHSFFTSLPLMRHLRELGYYATGTIRANRVENYLFLFRWNDNNVVTVATNFENWDLTSATRWSNVKKAKIAITQPSLIASYNKHMGGVDKCDQAVGNLQTRMRIRKWWWPIFAYFLDVSLVLISLISKSRKSLHLFRSFFLIFSLSIVFTCFYAASIWPICYFLLKKLPITQ